MSLTIPKTLVDGLASHAREAYPYLCCGLLAGANGVVSHLYRIKNIVAREDAQALSSFDANMAATLQRLSPAERPEIAFVMDMQDFSNAKRDIRTKRLDLLAVYHSHPHDPARPSVTTIKIATDYEEIWEKLLLSTPAYIIIGLRNRAQPEIKGYSITKGTVREVPLLLEGMQDNGQARAQSQPSHTGANASSTTGAPRQHGSFTDVNAVASTLKKIITTERIDPVADGRRFHAMLADVVAHQPAREREVLVRALKSPIFERTWRARTGGAPGTLTGLASWLAHEHGYADELSRWAVTCWEAVLDQKSGLY